MLTLPLVAGLGAAVLATSFLSGIVGMAGGMILMGILLALLPVPAAMILHGATQMASNGWRAFLWRRHVDWRIFLETSAGGLAALGLAALVRFSPDKATAYVVLGLTPFLAALVPARMRPNVERRGHSFVCGLLCVALQLTAGVAGPVLDTFYVRSQLDRRGVVATKAATQTFAHSLKLVYFGGLVGLGGDLVPIELIVLSVVVAMMGTTLSRRVLEALTDVQFRQWTQRLVLALGVAYIGQGLFLAFAG
jgi:uncharacterized protein